MKNFKIKKSNHRSKKSFSLFSAIIVLIAFFIIFSGKISDIFYYTSSPIQKSLASFSREFPALFGSFNDKLFLAKENEKLKKEKQKLVAEITFLKEFEKENEKLRNALNLGLADDFELIFANVSGFVFLEDYFLIDKGKKDEVLVGMPVVTEKRVVVGKVFETYENFSKIMLVTHKESDFFDAEIQDDEIMGIVRGEGKFRLVLDLIPREKEIREGDFIVTLGQIFPRGFPVGKVKETMKSETDPFQQIRISPFFDPITLRNVFVIKNY